MKTYKELKDDAANQEKAYLAANKDYQVLLDQYQVDTRRLNGLAHQENERIRNSFKVMGKEKSNFQKADSLTLPASESRLLEEIVSTNQNSPFAIGDTLVLVKSTDLAIVESFSGAAGFYLASENSLYSAFNATLAFP